MINTNKVFQTEEGSRVFNGSLAEFQRRVKAGKLLSADCGKKGVVLYDGTETVTLDPRDAFSYILDNYSGWSFSCENAHLGVARPEKITSSSLAQYWSADQLLDFYQNLEDADIILRLTPQQSTPTIQAFSGYNPSEDKNDENDAKAIHKYISTFDRFCLRKPPTSFNEDEVRKEGYRMKDAMNCALNSSKTNGYGAKDPSLVSQFLDMINRNVSGVEFGNKGLIQKMYESGDHFVDYPARFIYNNLNEITSRLSDNAKEAFFIYNKKEELTSFKMPQVYAILSALMGDAETNDEGKVFVNDSVRIRESQGEMAYWKFAKKHLYCFSPFHQKGGVAASNLKYHGQRHFVAKKSEEDGVLFKLAPSKFKTKAELLLDGGNELFSKNRAAYMKAIQEVFNLFRDMLLERENNRKPTSTDQCSKSTSNSQ